jgi:hypothetical protein
MGRWRAQILGTPTPREKTPLDLRRHDFALRPLTHAAIATHDAVPNLEAARRSASSSCLFVLCVMFDLYVRSYVKGVADVCVWLV